MKIQFIGATQTVTGSKYLLEIRGKKILVDCGLFQGIKELRLRNWAELPIKPEEIDAVLLTHAHIDHSGYIPILVKNGFSGPIYCSHASYDLCKILLPDSGHIHEEDARRANRYGYTKHKPALPLYTETQAHIALKQFRPVDFDKRFTINNKVFFSFHPVGHILGASYIKVDDGDRSIIFSGDVGRLKDPIMKSPQILTEADYLVLESTYGDRLHSNENLEEKLANIINETTAKGGMIIIPAFAVGRVQSVLYHINELKKHKAIGDIPVYLDSPMSISASNLFCKYHSLHKLSKKQCTEVFDNVEYVKSIEESKRIDASVFPSIIVSASGMATGGRVLHHLKTFIGNHKNTILFTGFQAAETRGRKMIEGAKEIKMHGEFFKVKARIEILESPSAHADYNELLEWLANSNIKPNKVFITHGEPKASEQLQQRLKERFAWETVIPEYLEEFAL